MRDKSNWLTLVSEEENNAGDEQPSPLESRNQDADVLDAYSRAVVGVAETVSPAVIGITTNDNDGRSGSGSAFIVTPDGYAVTNSHVMGGVAHAQATTSDGDRIAADLIGDDPSTDLALLRLSAKELPFVQIGDSDAVRVGQLVIAMGNPLGFQSTVSTGVVSAVGRAMRGGSGRLIESVVQHTAPLNPGNSGGPLLDSRGHVVGVNTAVIAFAQGLGFAVPSSTARWVISEMLAHGRVRRRQLGITAATVQISRRVVRDLDLLADRAIQVVDVDSQGPAAKAGIETGDLVVMISGRVATSVDDVHRLLAALPQDQPLVLSVVRDGIPHECTLSQ